MNGSLTFHASEIAEIFTSLVPLRIDLSDGEHGARTIDIESLKAVELVAGEGIRLVGAGRVTWPLGGFHLPVTLQEASVLLLCNKGVQRAGDCSLRLDVRVEKADVPLIPEFAEIPLVKRINDALEGSAPLLEFNVGTVLAHCIELPQMFLPSSLLRTRMDTVRVSVEAEWITLSGTLRGAIERAPAGPLALPNRPFEEAPTPSEPVIQAL